MKVLFAVSNENISSQIVKKYQKEYKEIISYKNIYYFNAIVKELQKDKSYDRIVISEDLEPFTTNNYDAIERFIFEKLDNISDESTGVNGKDIPIILLASDKITKSQPILLRLFGIGIYNVLLGQDRTTDNVCKLLNNPRGKKEAKLYYKIEADEVNYKSENENNVSEIEIKNILNHYRKLGNNEERYIESFNNIATQYNDAQLRIITKFLPLNVKAVLEERSPKYQSVMTFSDMPTSELMKKKNDEDGLKVGFLNYTSAKKPNEPVIVPTAVKKVPMKKINTVNNQSTENNTRDLLKIEEDVKEENNSALPGFDEILNPSQDSEIIEPVKRGRGRPRKVIPKEQEIQKLNIEKRGRGRPKKIVKEDISSNSNIAESILPGFDDVVDDEIVTMNNDNSSESVLPGFDDIEQDITIQDFNTMETTLPGFDEIETLSHENDYEKDEETTLPGFDEIEQNTFSENDNNLETTLPGFDLPETSYKTNFSTNVSGLISNNAKIVSFVGTTKNGTSFIVNNLAKSLSSLGIKTAILDLTLNRNAYYIYTKNDEKLRNIAYESIKKLENNIINGITVDKNLDVFTALPGDDIQLEESENIISTLAEKYSVILMDCDFNTPDLYFKIAHENYIVQSMDIFTIQPMTAFLRDLKAKGILEQEKIRIIINKEIRVKGLTPKVIVGGLSNYNDPAMSFMTELFDLNSVKYFSVPFYEDVCAKYLEGVMNCEITIKDYPKNFNAKLKELSNLVYPLIGNKNDKKAYGGNTFSTDMNKTLEQMKNKY